MFCTYKNDFFEVNPPYCQSDFTVNLDPTEFVQKNQP